MLTSSTALRCLAASSLSSSTATHGASSTLRRITATVAASSSSSQRRDYYGRGDNLGFNSRNFNSSEDLAGEGGIWDDGPAGYEWKSRVLKERRDLALDYMGDVRKRVPIHNAIRVRARLNKERLMNDINNPHGHLKAMRTDDDAEFFDHGSASNSQRRGRPPTMVLNEDSPAAILTEALRASSYNPTLDVGKPMGSDTDARLAVSAAYDTVSRDLLEGVRANMTLEERVDKGRHAVSDAIDLVEQELEDLVADEAVLETLAMIPPEDLKELRHEFFGGSPDTSSAHKDSTDETLRQWLKLRKDSSMFQSYMGIPADERKEWTAWYLRDIQTNRIDEDD